MQSAFKYIPLALTMLLLAVLPFQGHSQSITNSSYKTIGQIRSDGTIQDASYRTLGYIKSDGTVQDASYRTVGYAKGISRKWAAYYVFFSPF